MDDILTTGGSLLAMIPAVEDAGGEIVGCEVIVDRSGGLAALTSPATGRSYPLGALWRLDLPTWDAADGSCPRCAEGTPIKAPGIAGAPLRTALVAVIALLGLFGVATTAKGEFLTVHATATHCTASAMSEGVNHVGSGRVVSVQKFGCVDNWAFLWADVATGPVTIGVTNVMQWRPDLAEWRSVDRMVVCRPDFLPEIVYRQGCFSN